ncbi:MAG: FecR domain-containing protein [Spirochaetes bacterium]|nr:FecR domain-containing protein [Spirochaetota bacterium]
MKTLRKKMILCTGIMAVILSGIISCSKKQVNEAAIVSFVLGDVTIQRGADILKAEMREILKDGDIITTGGQSYMLVQMGTRLMFRVEAESRLEIKSITELGRNELNLTNGTVLSKLSKLKKDEQYNIKTPTTVASVRGTVFLTEYNNNVTNVAVTEGRVNIKQLESGDEKDSDAGMAAVVTEKISLRKIDSVEKLVLQKIEETAMIENIDSISSEDLVNEGDKIRETDERIDKEIDKVLKNAMTLDEIRSEYGRIDIVRMYTGKVYRGAILSRGNTIRMITPEGTISLDAKKIRQTESR